MMDKKLLSWATFMFFLFVWPFRTIKNYLRTVLLALRVPGPPALPILGNVLTIQNDTDLFEIAENAIQSYSTSIFRTWVFFVPFFFVYDPEHLKIILSSLKLSRKNIFYRIMHNFIGDGLVTSNDVKWKKHRRLIQPYFQINLLENYFENFAEGANVMVESMYGKSVVKITDIVNTCVVTILHKTVLGVSLKPGDETPFRRGELLVIKRVLKPWLLLDSVFKHSEMSRKEDKQNLDLHEYVKKALDERVKLRKSSNIKNTCLLDVFIGLSETTSFSQDDIINETVTFMLAGQDSVGSAVAFCLYYLAKHQMIQNKVFKEIDEIIYEDHLKTIKIEQLNQMHYLEQCIKETLRLAPSVPMVSRVLTSDVQLGKHTIPLGTNIFISPFITHRLPRYFPTPLEYNPDRFSPENVKKMHPFSFIPFSAGPRNCIGYKFAYLEMKTIVATVLKKYHLTLVPGCEDLTLSYKVTLRAKKGIWLQLQQRKPSVE